MSGTHWRDRIPSPFLSLFSLPLFLPLFSCSLRISPTLPSCSLRRQSRNQLLLLLSYLTPTYLLPPDSAVMPALADERERIEPARNFLDLDPRVMLGHFRSGVRSRNLRPKFYTIPNCVQYFRPRSASTVHQARDAWLGLVGRLRAGKLASLGMPADVRLQATTP